MLDVEQTAVILLAEQANLDVRHTASVSYAALYPQEAEAKWAFSVTIQPNFLAAFTTSYGNFVSLCKQRIRAHGYVPVYVILSHDGNEATIVMTKIDVLPTANEMLAQVKLRSAGTVQQQPNEPVVAHAQQPPPAPANGNGHAPNKPRERAIKLDMNNVAQALEGFDKWFAKDNGELLDHDDYKVEDYELAVLGGGNTELTIYLHSSAHNFTRGYTFEFDRHYNVIEATPGNEECQACMQEAHDNQSEADRLWDEGR